MWKVISLLVLLSAVLVYPTAAFAEGWGYSKSKDGNVPEVGRYKPMIDKYDGFYYDETEQPVVYLTFDNGYEQGYTGKVLDILKEKQVPAAFFVTGHYIESAPDLLKRMASEGHLIGNHSWSHPDFTKISKETMKEELDKVDEAVRKLTDQDVMTFVRPREGRLTIKHCNGRGSLVIRMHSGPLPLKIGKRTNKRDGSMPTTASLIKYIPERSFCCIPYLRITQKRCPN